MTNATAAALRTAADAATAAAEESFQRCDLDGFATQISHRLTASRLRLAAELVEHDGLARFWGLYEVATGRRVRARGVTGAFGPQWELHSSEAELIAKRGKRWLPVGQGSRVLRSLGLCQAWELAPAKAEIVAPEDATGFAGLEVTRADFVRDEDWGEDAARLAWVALPETW